MMNDLQLPADFEERAKNARIPVFYKDRVIGMFTNVRKNTDGSVTAMLHADDDEARRLILDPGVKLANATFGIHIEESK